ncbi:hypothetical protein JB92DRAFT_93839 [Gautieria morchelliformis]|nr:hypothetical protein JB92DRAFT_93839 [Gautieria morchelliformis]
MPAPARISVPVKQSAHVKPTDSSNPKTPPSIPRTKARVVHRRRARGRLGDTESDDELVREPHSDSDSESAGSTLDSESMSESELDNEAKPEARVPSPSETPFVAVTSVSSPPSHSPRNPLFQPSLDWSDMVADENSNGAAPLPVIDFADLSSHVEATPPPSHSVLSPSPPDQVQSKASRGGKGLASSSTAPLKPAQTARQAYLTRLDSDPAYVPTLGQFWSHDDRLLDKELRSLSGWWRGRWQGHGRGTRGRGGFARGWGMRGARGRGAFGNSGSSHPEAVPEEGTRADRSWTHDGFEELKKDEENPRQPIPFHGRGAFPRGRGGHRGSFPSRGGSLALPNRASSPRDLQVRPRLESQRSPTADVLRIGNGARTMVRPRLESQRSPTADVLRFGNGVRPWFAMKPERVWTKQFDGYLYFEPQLKPVHSQGIGQGVRIKLPGMKNVNKNAEELDSDAVVVRLPQSNTATPCTVPSVSKEPFTDRHILVRLPPSNASRKEREEHEARAPEDVTTVAPPPMDDLLPSVRSGFTPVDPTHLIQEAHPPTRRVSDTSRQSFDAVSRSQPSGSMASPIDLPPGSPVPQEMPLREPFTANNVAGSSQSHLGICPQGPENMGTASPQPPRAPVLPVLQAMASPFQPSPSYGSPYAYAPLLAYTPSTPSTPPMQVPMYNPRPIPMHHAHHGSMHFLPHHAHGHASSMSMSVSPPAFLSSPPIFALPRHSSRVEIRAPGEEKGKEREDSENLGIQERQTGSRLAANVNAEPFTPASHAPPHAMGYFSAEAQQQAYDNAQRNHQHQQSIYQPPPYYYPVNADGSTPYGYGQPYTAVDAGQPQQYDTYGQEPYSQQHAVYY